MKFVRRIDAGSCSRTSQVWGGVRGHGQRETTARGNHRNGLRGVGVVKVGSVQS